MRTKTLKQISSTVISAMLVASLTACSLGKGGDEDTADNNVTNVEDVANVNADSNTASTEPKEKVAVSDFYLYANEDWMNSIELQSDDPVYYRTDENGWAMYDRVDEMFAELKPEDFAEDDPMYKMVQLYNQFQDENQREHEAMTRIKEMTDYVRGIKNIEQLNEVMADSTYSLFNPICSIHMEADVDINFEAAIRVRSVGDLYSDLSAEERALLAEGIACEFEAIGYSAEEAIKMAENVNAFDTLVHDYYGTTSGYYDGYDAEYWYETNCPIDIPGILTANDYWITDRFGASYNWFFVYEDYADWLSTVVTSNNLDMICDYYAYSIVNELAACGSRELIAANISTTSMLAGADRCSADSIDDYSIPSAPVTYYDHGAIAAYFSSLYVTDEIRAEVEAMAEEIVNGYVAIIDSADWLDTKQKQRLKSRTKLTKYLIGEYEDYNHLEDMLIEDNLVDSVISLIKSNSNYEKRMLVEVAGADPYVDTSNSFFVSNAFYNSDSNTVMIGLGYLINDYLWTEATYEEKMAVLGTIIAHELGHAYDPSHSGYRANGEYDDAWDDFWEKYIYSVKKVADFYDGVITTVGEPLSGYAVVNEAFADFISMQAIMQAFENHDDIDYELFFTAYARGWGEVSTEEYKKLLLREDGHVLSHERVNGVLANIDKFYETFEVDIQSAWYVDQKDRTVIFAYEG